MSRFWRNLAALGFGFLLGGAASLSHAVEGCFYHDRCYENPADAVQAFSGSFPQLIGTQMHLYWSTDSIVGCDFSYQTAAYDAQNQIAWYPTQSAFQTCTVPEDVSSLVPNNFILVVACVILWAIGFSIGQKR